MEGLTVSEIADRAESMVRHDDQGGFPAQQQEPPGLTSEMHPVPDHGEETYVGLGWIEKAGRAGVLVPGDLVERQACMRVVADAVRGLGGLDILVNNAGYHWDRGPEGLEGLQPEHVERVMRTNLHAVLWLCQAALPHLHPGSSIINTTSIQAYDPSPALLDYAATKAAL